MIEYSVFQVAHLLLFVAWLSGDLASFYSSYYRMDPRNSVETREVIGEFSSFFDQFARVAMPLTLGTGLTLAIFGGTLALDFAWLSLIWPVCAIWATLVLFQHINRSLPLMVRKASKVEAFLRLCIATIVATLGISILTEGPVIGEYWIGLKTAVFAVLMYTGLAVRYCMAPVPELLKQIFAGTAAEHAHHTVARRTGIARLLVVMIWLQLLVAAIIGTLKPI